MRFTAILIIALVACSAVALKPKKMTSAQQKRIAEIKATKTWGGILLNLSELHVMAKGPLEELVQAIEDTVFDLQFQREKRDGDFEKRTNEHIDTVARLEADIANTQADIEEVQGILEQLAEQKAALEEENARLSAANAASRDAIVAAGISRGKEHAVYEEKAAEFAEAIAVVEECINILYEFTQSGASFAQVKVQKAKEVLALAQKKLAKHKSVEHAFINALVEVAVRQEFADQAAVFEVINKFNEIKSNLYDGSEQLAADEDAAQNVYEQFVADTNEEIYNNEQVISSNNDLLVQNAQMTVDNQNLLAELQAHLAEVQQALEDENNSYEDYKNRYLAWCEENDREVAVCQEALEVVAAADFDDYIAERVNAEDGLVSSGMAGATQHGQGTEVFNFDYDQF